MNTNVKATMAIHNVINQGKKVIPAPIFIGINSSRNPEKQ